MGKAGLTSESAAMEDDKVYAQKAVGFKHEPYKVAYNERDAIVYALGVGASELRWVFEDDGDFAVLPTYPVCLPFKGDSFDCVPFPPPSMLVMTPGLPAINPAMILHGEQYLEILSELPTSGDFTVKTEVIGLHDKGKGALMETESTMFDEEGKAIVKIAMGSFMRGLTGFQGAGRTYSKAYKPPARAPDAVQTETTTANQALLYRLSGDYNALHADPEIAESVGFKKPILHGLCSFGFAARAVLAKFCDNDASKFKAIKVRFASPVYPGETLVTSMWKEGTRVIFEVRVKERDVVVINNAFVDLNVGAKM